MPIQESRSKWTVYVMKSLYYRYCIIMAQNTLHKYVLVIIQQSMMLTSLTCEVVEAGDRIFSFFIDYVRRLQITDGYF